MGDLRLRDTREPMDYLQAVTVHRVESDQQKAAENFLSEKSREAAQAEKEYREGLATKIVSLKAEGTPATVARDLARGDSRVAELQMKRNVTEGLRDAAAQSIWRHTTNRRDLEQFIDWSKRAAFLDAMPPQEQPTTFGGRRAA